MHRLTWTIGYSWNKDERWRRHPASSRRTNDAAPMLGLTARGRLGLGTVERIHRPCPKRGHESLLLLPLLLFSAQLLAQPDAPVAGAARLALHAPSRLHGLSAIPRTQLALRIL